MNNPTFYARMGDFGMKAPEQFDAYNKTTRLAGVYSKGLTYDLDFYYLPRVGSKDGPLIGGISLQKRSATVPPDIGWCLLEEFMGKGYATEAAKEFLRYLQEDFGLKEIMAWPGVENRQSIRVAQKIELVKGGTVRSKETGKDDVVYIIPGMKWEENVTVSMWGDS
jgi:RimJ/RimL family protein N-acetyltransferase